ncbi:hypothetical protein [Polyangium sp. y55x31]|uniref:hypothetical protein n=1 Tax=Polyangium sp. y55x31 TaxID=3042688 RepID=UPI0024824EF3|nr:hypothetical protein [Polyangium sp. y55x31]MDI1476486.1 hypothetical protein [Polyangium sp. y55x31]
MPSRILDRRADALNDNEPVLDFALGLLAVCKKLDVALAYCGERAQGGGREEDEVTLHFVLGLISFRTNVLSVLEAARVPSPTERREGAGRRPPIRGLLR